MKYVFTVEIESTQKKTASKEERAASIKGVRGSILQALVSGNTKSISVTGNSVDAETDSAE